jgi:hypothetical protein
MSLIPVSPTCVSDIESEEEGLEPDLGILEVADGILPSTAEIADGFIFRLW